MRAAIILAAGASRRYGRRDKLKEKLAGKSLLEHVIVNARASDARRILLVTAASIFIPGVVSVRTKRARPGLSSSLESGLAALRPVEREVLIFLADMPFARPLRLRLRGGVDAIRPSYRGCPGHPVLIRTKAAKESVISGDVGLRRAGRTRLVAGATAHIFDIDTPGALRMARHHGSRLARRVR